jgi:cytidine deaminase
VSGTIDWGALVRAANEARANAYAPYSKYHVGAALLTTDGRIFAGCNVENASYPVGLCAERNAIGTAVAAGARSFAAAVVIAGEHEPGSPCGMCRQALAELPPSFPVRMYATDGHFLETTVDALLPGAFRLA